MPPSSCSPGAVNTSPAARCGMSESSVADGVYWVYRSDLCDQQFILPAITLARRFGAAALDHVEDLLAVAGSGADKLELEALKDVLADILTD